MAVLLRRHRRWRWLSPTAGSRRAGCGRACSTCRSRACRPSSTGCASRTSPTSTSAPPVARRASPSEAAVEWVRRAAARPRLSSRATCSRTRGGALCSSRCCSGLDAVRRARQPRRRRHARSVLARRAISSGLAGDAAATTSRALLELRGGRSSSPASTRAVRRCGERVPRARDPAAGSAHPPLPLTRRARRYPGRSSSCSPATCTPARS